MSQVKVCSPAGSIKNARATHSAQFAFHSHCSHEAHIIMGRHIASIADSVCTGISNGAGRERRARRRLRHVKYCHPAELRRRDAEREREGEREGEMIPQAEFHLSSNNDAHHIRRPRPLSPGSLCLSVGRARCRCHHSLAGDIILYLRRREGGMEISETVRPRVRIRGISKIQTTAAQECRVGFHGKCRRYQREFSPTPTLSPGACACCICGPRN